MDKDISRVNGPTQTLEPSKGGRPTKLTPAVQNRIVAAIKAGHFRESAARLAGISPATLYRWLSAETEPYQAFQEAVEAAEAELEREVLEVVTERIREDPRLALTFLSKRFPARWGSGAPATMPSVGQLVAQEPPQVNVLVVDRNELEDAAQHHLEAHRQRLVGPSQPPGGHDSGNETRGGES